MVETLRRLVGQGALVLDAPSSSSSTTANTTTSSSSATAPGTGAGAPTGITGAASIPAVGIATGASSSISSGGGDGGAEADWAHEFECVDAVRRLAHHAGEGVLLLRPHLREVAAFLVRAVQVRVCVKYVCVCRKRGGVWVGVMVGRMDR